MIQKFNAHRCLASQVAQKVSGMSIEQMGGVGFTRELGVEKYWRDSKIGAIYEGMPILTRFADTRNE